VNDILERIVARTRERLAAASPDVAALRRTAAERAAARVPFAFSEALRRKNGGKARVIAEIKAASPSAGPIVSDPDVESIAAEYRLGGAAALSIVTERDFFHGSTDWIDRAAGSGLPVIMKDFVVDPRQIYGAVAAGTSALLLLASLLDGTALREFIAMLDEYSCDALVEVHDESELERAVEGGARLIGVNNRNLRDFAVTLETSERMVKSMPPDVVKVSESGIRVRADVERLQTAGFDAFLVGETLLRQSDRAAAVRKLVG
jgi:indole-3-glycerol phosphate synthase